MTHHPRWRRLGAAVAVAGIASTLAACGSQDPTAPSEGAASGDTVVVGSFAYPESEILAEIYAQALEANDFDVEEQFNIGPRQQTIPALQDGSINLIPEYNGNLLTYYDTENTLIETSEIDEALVDAVAADGLQVLDSAPAEDKDAYVVTREKAEAEGLSSIADLEKLQPFKLGANPQFNEYSYGLPGLKSTYGITDVEFVPIEDFGGPDTVKALVDDTVQVADIYTTSPALVAEDLVVLEDPEGIIAAQNVIPLVSDAAYSDELAEVLNAVSAELTTEDLIGLRERVEGEEKASAETAAADWLAEKGLV